MLKPGFWVSLSTGVHLSLKKLTEYRNIYQNTCIGGTYVSDPQVGCTPYSLSVMIMNVEMERNVKTKMLS